VIGPALRGKITMSEPKARLVLSSIISSFEECTCEVRREESDIIVDTPGKIFSLIPRLSGRDSFPIWDVLILSSPDQHTITYALVWDWKLAFLGIVPVPVAIGLFSQALSPTLFFGAVFLLLTIASSALSAYWIIGGLKRMARK
jgi:hypothetical protein